jgi:phosphohistidine swiveling domain-containing protein
VALLQKGLLSEREFMNEYGHLRPGTYDIKSKRYDQVKDLYKDNDFTNSKNSRNNFELSYMQKKQINSLLKESGFDNFFADDLIDYVRQSISGREYGKFVFTRSISDMLELIAEFAKFNGLDRDDASHIPLNTLLSACDNGNVNDFLKRISKKEADKYYTNLAIRLPQLIYDASGVYVVPFQVSHPNFITSGSITAQCIVLDPSVVSVSLKDKIVIIEGADPGYDWIFTHQIAGLITKYGGSNSHMAIRCAEFNIPAAIGCGDQKFQGLLNSKHVQLDCAAGLINII